MDNPVTAPQLRELDRAARLKGLPFRLFDVRERDDIESAEWRSNRAYRGGPEQGLVENGLIEGKGYVLDVRWAEGEYWALSGAGH